MRRQRRIRPAETAIRARFRVAGNTFTWAVCHNLVSSSLARGLEDLGIWRYGLLSGKYD